MRVGSSGSLQWAGDAASPEPLLWRSSRSRSRSASDEPPLPSRLTLELERRLPLRYGENPHQSAALFAPVGTHLGLAGLKQLSGKELSYNNLLDLDGATRLAGLLADPAAVVVNVQVVPLWTPAPTSVSPVGCRPDVPLVSR